MEENFIITVEYKGKEIHLDALLLQKGYSHSFKVMVNNTVVFFEPDEERNYRAVLPPDVDEKAQQNIDRELLQSIAETIHNSLA